MRGGEVLMESDHSGGNQTEYIFFNGQRIARRDPSGTVYYFFSDHLGSNRIVTNATGGGVEDSDFFPFSAERVVVDQLNNNYKFTGHERDGESGLDFMVARHYAFTLGRFLQPDAPFADQQAVNPQSWNLYTYTLNNPLRFTDPTGRQVEFTSLKTFASPERSPDPDEEIVQSPFSGSLQERAEESAKFLKEELKGVGSVLHGATIGTAEQLLTGQAAEGFNQTVGTLATTPMDVADAILLEAKNTANAVASGDPRAIGQVVGIAALFAAPFAKGSGTGTTATRAATETVGTKAVGGRITGYTEHGINSAISHPGGGVAPRAILDAVKNPIKTVPQAGGKTLYVGKDANVVLNSSGKVVTTYPTSASGIRGGQ